MDENKVVENVESVSSDSNSKTDLKATVIKCIAALLCVVLVAVTLSQCVTKYTENNIAIAELKGSSAGSAVSGGAADTSVDDSVVVDDSIVTDDGTVVDDGTATDTDATVDSSADASTDSSASTDKGTASTDKGSSTSTASKKPSTKAEIVAYFNKAVNGVKTGAKTVEQKGVTNYLASQTTISSGIKSIYNMLGGDEWLDGMLKDNSQGAATYTGADIKAKFPVEGESYASKLTESDVKSATCTESNGVYTIKITTVADAKSSTVKHGEGHAPKAFNVILPGVVNDNIPGVAKSLVGTASMDYPSSTATITVDVATGHVLTAEYDLKWTINFDEMGIILPFGTKSVYNIKW